MIERRDIRGKRPFQWIDITDPDEGELGRIAEEFSLEAHAVQDCLQPEHLPKYERSGDTVFIIARAYDTRTVRDADSIQDVSNKVAIFAGRSFLITIHRSEQPILRELHASLSGPGASRRPDELLIAIMYRIFRSYQSPVMELEAELDRLEARIVLQESTHGVLRTLHYLKRKAAVILRILRLSHTILDNLSRHAPAAVHQDLRETVLGIETTCDQVSENAANLLHLFISLSGQRTNDVMRVLTLFSVFFLPLTFIVGIYGMNFDVMPELRHPYGYPLVILTMVLITLGIYLWFRKKRWL